MLLIVIINIPVIAFVGSLSTYIIGRHIIKYDPNIDHKRIFSSDSFNILFPTFLFYAFFIYVVYYLLFKIIFKVKNSWIFFKGFATACLAIVLIEIISNNLAITRVGLTPGKIVFYFSIFFMSILLPVFHRIIKKRIVEPYCGI
ncbi:MAG: hypothetical protein ABI237_01190 [Ginsengibacter sp.]